MIIRSIVALVAIALAVTSAFADEGDIPGFAPYLGLAFPYPDTIPELTLALDKDRNMDTESLLIMIEVDSTGSVLDIVEFPSLSNHKYQIQLS
jgi:hypothetical protein